MKLASDGRKGAERIAATDRALVARHHDAPVAFGFDRLCGFAIERKDGGDFLSPANGPAQAGLRHKKAIDRRGVVNLQMRFLRVAREAQRLFFQAQRRTGQNADLAQQLAQAAVERAEIPRFDAAGAAALQIDGRNVAHVCGAKGAARQEGTGPAPEIIKAGRHGALGFSHRVRAGEVAGPRQQFVGASTAVQIDVVGALREQLGIEQVSEALRGRTVGTPGKSPREVATISGMTAFGGEKSRFVQHGHHDHRAGQPRRTPFLHPLAQERGSFIFVAVRGAVQQQHRTRSTAPDESVETDTPRLKALVMKTGGEAGKIHFEF